MALLSRIKRSPIAHLLLAINFVISGVTINLMSAILYYCLRPISRRWFRILNFYLNYSLNSELLNSHHLYWSFIGGGDSLLVFILKPELVFLAEWWAGADIQLYTEKENFEKYYNKEHAYLIMNHRYETDWLMGWLFCERVGVLGNCKTYAKKAIQYVPTMGWSWKFAESVFLERNWEKDCETIGRQLRELVSYPTPMWLLLTAEGTRFTKEKHAASVKFCEEKDIPPMKHHLFPRTRGFLASLPHMRGKVGAIYDVQLAFPKYGTIAPTMTNLLQGEPIVGHLYVERIPLEDVPEDPERAGQWLKDLYYKKDRMADSFERTNDFFAESGVKRVEPIRLKRRYYSLINTVSWSFVTLTPIGYQLFSLLTSGSTVQICIGIAIILLFFVLLSKLIGMTKISKASSYGTSDKLKSSPSADTQKSLKTD